MHKDTKTLPQQTPFELLEAIRKVVRPSPTPSDDDSDLDSSKSTDGEVPIEQISD